MIDPLWKGFQFWLVMNDRDSVLFVFDNYLSILSPCIIYDTRVSQCTGITSEVSAKFGQVFIDVDTFLTRNTDLRKGNSNVSISQESCTHTHIFQGCIPGTGAIMRLSNCWPSSPRWYIHIYLINYTWTKTPPAISCHTMHVKIFFLKRIRQKSTGGQNQ